MIPAWQKGPGCFFFLFSYYGVRWGQRLIWAQWVKRRPVDHMVLSDILQKPEDSVREWFRPPGREPARRCVPLSSQTIGRVMASLRPFLFSLIRPPASEEPATTTISSIYQPHIRERGAIGERAWERENKRKVWVEQNEEKVRKKTGIETMVQKLSKEEGDNESWR